MKILYFHAKDLRIEAGNSGRKNADKKLIDRLGSALPVLDANNRSISSKNTLLALICVEEGDERLELDEVRTDILKSRSLLGTPDIVLGAFAHLSDKTAQPILARRIIDHLYDAVRVQHIQTVQFPFGWEKSLDLHIPCHHFSASFRSFPPKISDWDVYASLFDQYMLDSGHYNAQFRLLERLDSELLKDKRILELCCGSGRFLSKVIEFGKQTSKEWLQPAAQFFGIDSSEGMLKLAFENLGSRMKEAILECTKAEYADALFESICRDERKGPIEVSFEELKFGTVFIVNGADYIELEKVLEILPRLMLSIGKLVIFAEDPFLPAPEGALKHSSLVNSINQRKHYFPTELKQLLNVHRFIQISESREPIDDKHDLVGMVFQFG